MRSPWPFRWVWESWALGCLVLGQYEGLNLVGLSVLLAVATELGLLAGFRLLRTLPDACRRVRNRFCPHRWSTG